jgi:hypothetical protein
MCSSIAFLTFSLDLLVFGVHLLLCSLEIAKDGSAKTWGLKKVILLGVPSFTTM